MAKRRLLTALEVDEVSGVDDPANEDARVVLLKAADAIPGIAAIRKSLDAHGDEAVEAFNEIVAARADAVAAIIAKAADDEDAATSLSRMAHALGESVDSIFKAGDEDGDREALLVETGTQFADAVDGLTQELGVAKAKRPAKKKADKPEATEADAEEAAEAADDLADALSGQAETIKKAAATFNELNANREEREKLNRMAWALQDSLSSIMSDPEVKPKDKPAMIRKSVGEFDAAVAALMGEVKKARTGAEGDAATGGNAAGGAGNPKESEMSEGSPSKDDGRDTVLKSMQAELAELRSREAKREAVAKAKGMLPSGGPVDALGALLVSATAEQIPHIEAVVKGLAAQIEATRMFGSVGAAAAHSGDMIAESPIVKAAKAEVEKRRARAA